jgi:HYR domain/Secretion system C-terminal sorting domain
MSKTIQSLRFFALFSMLFSMNWASLHAQSDNCATATAIACGAALTNQTNVGATNDAFPICNTNGTLATGAANVWYQFAGNGQAITVSTCTNTAFDSEIGVFSGSCGNLVCIAGNDNDDCSTDDETVTFPSTLGTTYFFMVQGHAGASGTFTLNVTCAPIFNPCAAPIETITCESPKTVTVSGTGVWATGSCGFNTPGVEKVFSFTPSVTGMHTIDVTSATSGSVFFDYQFKLASAGCSATGWNCIDDISAVGTVTFGPLTAGTTYLILLDPEGISPRSQTFQINCPAPDPCAAPIETIGCATPKTIALSGAGVWPTSECGFTTPGNEKVLSFTPTVTGMHTLVVNSVSAVGFFMDYQFKLASAGCSQSGWNCISSFSDVGNASFGPLTAGTTYLILLDAGGSVTRSQTFQINCPATFDPCAAPIEPITCASPKTISLQGAGAGWNIATCGSPTLGREKVYGFTAPTTGTYTLQVTNVTGSSATASYFVKEASAGCSSSGWTCISAFPSPGSSSFSLTGGVAYLILVDGNNINAITHTFQIICPPSCPIINSVNIVPGICNGQAPAPFVVNTDQIGTPNISWVRFTSPQTNAGAYTGGTLLGNSSTNAAGQATFTPTAAQFPNTNFIGPITYYVYPIITPTPTDPLCRPTSVIQVVVAPTPSPALAVTNNMTANTQVTTCVPDVVGNVLFDVSIRIENTGNVPMFDLQLIDPLGANLGAAFVGIRGSITVTSASVGTVIPTINPSFNGMSPALLFAGSATAGTTGILLPGGSLTVRFQIEVNPNANCPASQLNNQVRVLGAVSACGSLLTANTLSNNFSIFAPALAISKDFLGFHCSNSCGNGAVNAVFEVKVENIGNTLISNVNINDVLPSTSFGLVRANASSIQLMPHLSRVTSLPAINANWNGSLANASLFSTGATFSPCDFLVVRFTVEYNQTASSSSSFITNAATATGNASSPSGTNFSVTDASDSGTIPESTNPGALGDTGCEDDATPLFLPAFTTLPKDITVNACDPWQNDIAAWMADNAGARFDHRGNTVNCIVNDYLDTQNPWVSAGCGLNMYKTVHFTIKYTDRRGNMSEMCFCAKVTVQDNTGPRFDMLPMDKTIACGSTAPAMIQQWLASYGGAWVFDCGSDITVTNNYSAIAGTCGARTVTFTATDQCGQSASASAVLTINDSTPPTFSNVPANTTITCPAVASFIAPTANDNCGAATISFTDATTGGPCPVAGTLTRTYVATDACGNTATASSRVTILAPAPQAILTLAACPANINMTAPFGATGMAVTFATPTATSTCTIGSVTVTQLGIPTSGQVFPLGATQVNFRATDGCGNTQTCSFIVTITNAPAPVSVLTLAACPANINMTAPFGATGMAVTFATPTATSTCTTGSVTVTQLGIPTSGQVFPLGATQVNFRATDGCGNTQTCSFVVTITNAPAPVSVLTLAACPANINMTAPFGATGMAVTFATPTATSTCTTGQTAVTQIAGPTSGQTFAVGATQVTFRATDGCGNTKTCGFTVTITPTTVPPSSVLTLTVAPTRTISCGQPITFSTPVTSTTCPVTNVNVTFIDANTGTACAGRTYTRTFTATDACANVKTAVETIFVAPDQTPPVFTSLPPTDLMINCGTPVNIGTATASDNCGSATVTSIVTNNGASACNTVNGITYGFDTYVKWTATDGCGNTAVANTNIWVLPVTNIGFLKQPDSKTVACNESVIFDAPPMAKSFMAPMVSMTHDDVLAVNACGAGTVTRTWTALDELGNTCKAEQVITILPDGIAPAMALPQSDFILQCGEPMPMVPPTATDNCTGTADLQITHTDVHLTDKTERTWTVTDLCGNASTAMQTMWIQDNMPPVFAPIAPSYEVECGTTVTFDNPSATDACSAVTITFTNTVQYQTCQTVHTRVWTALDASGNASNLGQTITVKDQKPPVFAILPQPITLTCGQPILFDTPSATDACNLASVQVTNTQTQPICNQTGYTMTRTWMANDGCNNLAFATQTITIAEDVTAPQFTSVIAPQLDMTAQQFAQITQPTAQDNCAQTVTVTHTSAQTDPCNYVVTFVATDACGNATTATQKVHITDGICAPLAANDITLEQARIYPNPTTGQIFIALPSELIADGVRVRVFDALGKQVQALNLNKQVTTLYLSDLADGIYQVQLGSQQQSATMRIVKTKR